MDVSEDLAQDNIIELYNGKHEERTKEENK